MSVTLCGPVLSHSTSMAKIDAAISAGAKKLEYILQISPANSHLIGSKLLQKLTLCIKNIVRTQVCQFPSHAGFHISKQQNWPYTTPPQQKSPLQILDSYFPNIACSHKMSGSIHETMGQGTPFATLITIRASYLTKTRLGPSQEGST